MEELTPYSATIFSALFLPLRCYATIGQGEGEQTLSLGKGCGTPGFALHELAHVIGKLGGGGSG